jgi:peptidoglycan/LPS O-acetylase OafA/YrhL
LVIVANLREGVGLFILQNENLSNYYLFLRVFASHVVVIGHAASFFNVLPFTQWPRMPYVQSMCVIVFFFISGFTIAWLCDQRKSSLEKFAFDRFSRLVIPLIPVLILYALLESILFDEKSHPYPDALNLTTFVANLFFLQSFPLFQFEPFGTNRPLWSIAPEWWLYIAYGFLVLRISSRRLFIKMLFGAMFIVSIAFSFYYASFGRGSGLPLIWLIGAAMWPLIRDRRFARIHSGALSCLLVVSILLLFYRGIWPSSGDYSRIWNIFVVIPLFISSELISRSRQVRLPKLVKEPLDYMSRYSYTLYLCHYPLMAIVVGKQYLQSGSLTGFMAVVMASLALAIILAQFFEFRYKAYRDMAWALITSRAKALQY